MATDKKPKGILKSTSSFDNPTSERERNSQSKEMKWDEMNILATHHPPDKDYGHMKIDEPPTPYSKYSDPEDDDDGCQRKNSIGKLGDIDPESIASRLADVQGQDQSSDRVDEEDSSEEEIHETAAERAKRKQFEQKRKLHYNEFQAVKLAKQLMEEEDEDDNDEEEEKDSNTQKETDNVQSQSSNTDSIH